jgi:hypothetical protein
VRCEWSLGILTPRPPQVEIVATPVAALDAQNSKVSGDKANIQVRLARGLEQDRVKLGYRLYAPGKVTRGVLQGGSMTWSEEENVSRGEATIALLVSYDEIAQNHYWLFDPHQRLSRACPLGPRP